MIPQVEPISVLDLGVRKGSNPSASARVICLNSAHTIVWAEFVFLPTEIEQDGAGYAWLRFGRIGVIDRCFPGHRADEINKPFAEGLPCACFAHARSAV